MTPFDHIKSLSKTKQYAEDITEFVPHLTNISFSLYEDTILLANEMNMLHELPDRMQYDFYFYAVRPRSRYTPWPKKTTDENLAAIQEYYKYSTRKAKQAMALLSDEQIEIIKKRLYKGGPE